VERDAIELRGAHGPDEADALQAGQRAVVDLDALAIPPHGSIRTHVRYDVKAAPNTNSTRSPPRLKPGVRRATYFPIEKTMAAEQSYAIDWNAPAVADADALA
jgi:hypothetical protein